MQGSGTLRASALGEFLRGCSEFSAFARCAAGALGLAAFCRLSANAPVRKEPPKRSCAPDAARSPLAIRVPEPCIPRRRPHRYRQSPLTSPRVRRVQDPRACQKAGRRNLALLPTQRAGDSPPLLAQGNEAAGRGSAGACVAVSGSAHGERRASGVRRAAPLWWFLPDQVRLRDPYRMLTALARQPRSKQTPKISFSGNF